MVCHVCVKDVHVAVGGVRVVYVSSLCNYKQRVFGFGGYPKIWHQSVSDYEFFWFFEEFLQLAIGISMYHISYFKYFEG